MVPWLLPSQDAATEFFVILLDTRAFIAYFLYLYFNVCRAASTWSTLYA
jgi:hypothetical protein